MGIRIQPREVEIPQDDPFKYDLLGRRESVEVLTSIIGSFEGPCVLSVDAPWGSGKTTFLKIWAQYLRNRDFPVVSFNAWETDYSDDPFVAISSELTSGFRDFTDDSISEMIAAVRTAGNEMLRRAIPSVIRVASAGLVDISPLFEKEIGQTLASYADDRLRKHQEAKDAVKEFQEKLGDMAATLSAFKDSRPLVIIIDELDRCRPSYAIELLEVAKHLFSVDHVVFVLGINRSQLAHSVRAIYGNDFDAEGYLGRFIDLDFQLPPAKHRAFIENSLAVLNFDDYFSRTKDYNGRGEYDIIKALLLDFLGSLELSLREIGQALHRLGLLFAALRSDRRTFGMAAAVALIIRTVDLELYQKFTKGEVADLEVVDAIFNLPGAEKLRTENSGYNFEAIVIVAALQMRDLGYRQLENGESKLWSRYKREVDEYHGDDLTNPSLSHASRVMELVRWYMQDPGNQRPVGFNYAFRRLELLSSDLMLRESL